MPPSAANKPHLAPLALLAAALSLAHPSPGAAAEAALRLSGVLTVSDKPTVAIVVLPDGRQRTVRPGSKIPKVGQVLSIGRDRIVMRTPDGDKEFLVEGGDPSAAAPPKAPANAATQRGPSVVDMDDNIRAVLDKLERDPSATIQDLSFALRPLLDLPPNAELTLMQSMGFKPAESVAQFRQQLNQGGQMARIKVDGVEGREMIYLALPKPGKPAGP